MKYAILGVLLFLLASPLACLPKPRSIHLGCELPPKEYHGAHQLFCSEKTEDGKVGCMYISKTEDKGLCLEVLESAWCSPFISLGKICGVKFLLPSEEEEPQPLSNGGGTVLK